ASAERAGGWDLATRTNSCSGLRSTNSPRNPPPCEDRRPYAGAGSAAGGRVRPTGWPCAVDADFCFDFERPPALAGPFAALLTLPPMAHRTRARTQRKPTASLRTVAPNGLRAADRRSGWASFQLPPRTTICRGVSPDAAVRAVPSAGAPV